MALTNAGRDAIAKLLVGDAQTLFNAANAHIGAGNGTTAFAASQTDLQGASKTRKAMEATYPSRASNVITFRSLFGTSDANYAWEEWGVFNGASGGEMLNRKVESLGTKTSAQSWQITAQLTITAG